nr:unnamed protein product [Spirometra erinaceieuropaei]
MRVVFLGERLQESANGASGSPRNDGHTQQSPQQLVGDPWYVSAEDATAPTALSPVNSTYQRKPDGMHYLI